MWARTFCLYLSPVGDFDDFKCVVPTIIGGALYVSINSSIGVGHISNGKSFRDERTIVENVSSYKHKIQ